MHTFTQCKDSPERLVAITVNSDWSGDAAVTVGFASFEVDGEDLLAGVNPPPGITAEEWGRAVAFAVHAFTTYHLGCKLEDFLDRLPPPGERHAAIRKLDRKAERAARRRHAVEQPR